jgi:hypothetical protein
MVQNAISDSNAVTTAAANSLIFAKQQSIAFIKEFACRSHMTHVAGIRSPLVLALKCWTCTHGFFAFGLGYPNSKFTSVNFPAPTVPNGSARTTRLESIAGLW